MDEDDNEYYEDALQLWFNYINVVVIDWHITREVLKIKYCVLTKVYKINYHSYVNASIVYGYKYKLEYFDNNCVCIDDKLNNCNYNAELNILTLPNGVVLNLNDKPYADELSELLNVMQENNWKLPALEEIIERSAAFSAGLK